MDALTGCAAVLVDMPIGFASGPPGRAVEKVARKAIGPRRSSVFEPPLRPALAAATQDEATRLNRAAGGGGISAQCFHIIRRMREIDGWITPERQARVMEGHPEFAFRTLAGRVLAHPKRKAEGRAERASLLTWAGFDLAALEAARRALGGIAPDDLLDACVLAHAAWRVANGVAERIPAVPGTDARGLRMEMWA